MINRAPQVMRLAVDPNKNLIQVPAPIRIRTIKNPPLPDLRSEHRAEPVPPKTYRLMADIDATFEQHALNLAQRQRVADVHHHREADDLGRRVEIAERISHPTTLRNEPTRLKPTWSDSAAINILQNKLQFWLIKRFSRDKKLPSND